MFGKWYHVITQSFWKAANHFFQRWKVMRVNRYFTNADLSVKTDSATSLAFHVLLSLDGNRRELGGPICEQKRKVESSPKS